MKRLSSHLCLPRMRDGGMYLVLLILTITFLVQIIQSLGWRLQFDSAIMHYIAYLINEHGFAPYHDIFDINMPGSYLVHMAIGKLVGYSDKAFRIVDIIWLFTTLVVTWLVMKPAGRVAAWASCLLFGLIYIVGGAYMGFQRDFLAILPMTVALLLVTRRRLWPSVTLSYVLLGGLFGLAALIKPHMIIGLPALVIYSLQGKGDSQPALKPIKAYLLGGFFALIGLFLTLTIPFLWLWKIGSLQSFWKILLSYFPLYAQMNLYHNFAHPLYRLKQSLILYFEFGGAPILLLSSLFSTYYICKEPSLGIFKRLSVLLLSLTLIYSIYASISGRFLPYHWIPYIYFACLCTGLILATPSVNQRLNYFSRLVPVAVFMIIVVVTIRPVETVFQLPTSIPQLLARQLPPPQPLKSGRVDEIASYLSTHLQPNDRVHPLDWDGGAVHGMLIAKAVPATSYIYDLLFYHHISTPYIQGLRQDFLKELAEAMPTFIIDVHQKTRVSGIDTTHEFPELENFISQNYRRDYAGNGFEILKKTVANP